MGTQTLVGGKGTSQVWVWVCVRIPMGYPCLTLVVLDGGYNVPGGYAGRVFTGMGPGPYLGTHTKPITREYP